MTDNYYNRRCLKYCYSCFLHIILYKWRLLYEWHTFYWMGIVILSSQYIWICVRTCLQQRFHLECSWCYATRLPYAYILVCIVLLFTLSLSRGYEWRELTKTLILMNYTTGLIRDTAIWKKSRAIASSAYIWWGPSNRMSYLK